jgi:hypothetical protein
MTNAVITGRSMKIREMCMVGAPSERQVIDLARRHGLYLGARIQA